VGNSRCKKGGADYLVPRTTPQPTAGARCQTAIPKNISEARPKNRNLAGATANAPGAELANSSHSHECLVGSHLQAPDQHGAAGKGPSGTLSFSDLVSGSRFLDFDDDGDSAAGTVLGRKVVISAQSGKHKVTKVEGIPAKHSLGELLKKMRATNVLSCGGHVAKDKASGRELLVLQGSVSAAVAAFLVREGVADSDSIVRRG
jgi:translation initiation factor 1 (eIF-1/SUI1)